MDRRFENALDMESDGFPLRNKKRNFDRGQIPVFKIPLPLQMVGIARFELATFCPPVISDNHIKNTKHLICTQINVILPIINHRKTSTKKKKG